MSSHILLVQWFGVWSTVKLLLNVHKHHSNSVLRCFAAAGITAIVQAINFGLLLVQCQVMLTDVSLQHNI